MADVGHTGTDEHFVDLVASHGGQQFGVVWIVRAAQDRLFDFVQIDLNDFGNGDKWTGRLYHLQFKEAAPLFGNLPVWKTLEGFYTLNAIPKAK